MLVVPLPSSSHQQDFSMFSTGFLNINLHLPVVLESGTNQYIYIYIYCVSKYIFIFLFMCFIPTIPSLIEAHRFHAVLDQSIHVARLKICEVFLQVSFSLMTTTTTTRTTATTTTVDREMCAVTSSRKQTQQHDHHLCPVSL